MARALSNKTRQKNVHDFTVLLYPESDPVFKGYYNAIVPALPGCVSYGESRTEALKNIREAVELYLEDLIADGEPVPEDRTEQVQLEIAA